MTHNDDQDSARLISFTMPDQSVRKVPIVVCIANYEQWEKGELVNIWHPFPTTAQELQAVLTEIGAEADSNNEFFLSGCQSEIDDLRGYMPEFANLDELNYLANKLNDMTDEERQIFGAVIHAERYCESISQMIDITENLDLFDLQPAHTLREYTAFIKILSQDEQANGIEKLAKSADPDMRGLVAYIERLEKFVDYREYTREVVKSEKGAFTDYGYLTERAGFNTVYARSVPEQYRVVMPVALEPEQRPSAMDRLSAAKDAVAKKDAENPTPVKSADVSHDTEL